MKDPETMEIRYVGKATRPDFRYNQHMRNLNCDFTYKGKWIKSLKARGIKPVMDILEWVADDPDSIWKDAERWWISYLRFIGCRLVNTDVGGMGGRKMTEEEKAIARSKRIITGQTRALWSAARKGKKHTAEHKAKISAAGMGRIVSAETREKISASNRKRWSERKASKLA